MESLPEKKGKNEEKLMDLIYKEKKYIFDYYSIHELEKLLNYANNDRKKIFYLLDNNSKEENMKFIEENEAQLIIKNKNLNNIGSLSKINIKKKKIEKYIIVSRTIKEIEEKGDIKNSDKFNIVWNFIHHQGINFIDLFDALNSFDKNKLYNKIKEEINEKNKKSGADKKDKIMSNVALVNELNKRFEKKENKIYDRYINNFEENDIYYLKKTGQWKYYSKTIKEKPKNEIIEKQNLNLYNLLKNVSNNQRIIIFSFIDIFTLGKLGLCNKTLYTLVYKKYKININSAKLYISALFANSKLYEVDPKKIKVLYKNSFLEMLKMKPRIKFCGIYYSRVKIIREYFKYGLEYNNHESLIYYRVLRFFPNGEVYAMTCPYFKSHKIKHGIKEGSIEFKNGNFKIDENNNVLVKYTNGDEYIYRLGWSDFSIYRMGFRHEDPGIKNGLELLSYEMIDKYGEKTKIKLDENFPKRFRFRNIDYLKNDIYIHKYEEFIDEIKADEINEKNEDNNNTITTISTEENSINENNS